MKSRRQFIKSCLYLSLSGLGGGLSQMLNGCTGRTALSSIPNRKMEKPPPALAEPQFEPAYIRLHRTGELKRRGEELWGMLEDCKLCPRECGVNRLKGERGFCAASSGLEIASYQPDFGEGSALVGKRGSGTIFFTHCGLKCVYCNIWDISQGGKGGPKRIEDLAAIMTALQRMGCHNINLVTPAHYIPHIVLATELAASEGLRLPLVYHSSGWERPLVLSRLSGIVDVYLASFKYTKGKNAAKYSSGAKNYPETVKAALLEMQRQVGTATPREDGLVSRGLMVRHMVLPNGVSGTKQVTDWVAKNLPKDTYFMILSQYSPTTKTAGYPEMTRTITREEYGQALNWAEKAGLTNLDVQGYGA